MRSYANPPIGTKRKNLVLATVSQMRLRSDLLPSEHGPKLRRPTLVAIKLLRYDVRDLKGSPTASSILFVTMRWSWWHTRMKSAAQDTGENAYKISDEWASSRQRAPLLVDHR